jgi:hypothetical protein
MGLYKDMTPEQKKNNPEKWEVIRQRYRSTHRDDVRAQVKRWRKANPEKETSRKLEWAKANPEKEKKAILECNRRNKDKVNERNRAKTAAMRSSVLVETYKPQIKAIYAEAQRISKETGIKHVVDHIMPLIGENFRGLHVPWNLQILTFEDNVRKGNKVIQWL